MTGSALTKPSTTSPQSSLQVRSTSTLLEAIHSPNDKGATLKRANEVLALYFDPDPDPETRAAVRAAFVQALDHLPDWAIQSGFDQWVKTMARRPSPAEIVILAERAIRPLTDELARRARIETEQREANEARDRNKVSPERAAELMAEYGFDADRSQAVKRFPMAQTMADVERLEIPHEPSNARHLDPAYAEALRKARDENPIVQAARVAGNTTRS